MENTKQGRETVLRKARNTWSGKALSAILIKGNICVFTCLRMVQSAEVFESDPGVFEDLSTVLCDLKCRSGHETGEGKSQIVHGLGNVPCWSPLKE